MGKFGEMLDCADVDEINNDSIQFNTDDTGKPGDFKATQSFGVFRFTWTDNSLCEEAFSFSREIDGNGVQTRFVEDASFAGDTECNEQVDILAVVDNLRGNPDERWTPQKRTYCIRAVSTTVGYASEKVCTEVAVAWEAAIQGRVLSKRGSVPIAGIAVTWDIRNKAGNVIKASEEKVFSGADGRFTLHILDKNAGNEIADDRLVHLHYWKIKRSAVVMEHSTSFGVPMDKAVAATTLRAMWKTQNVATNFSFCSVCVLSQNAYLGTHSLRESVNQLTLDLSTVDGYSKSLY